MLGNFLRNQFNQVLGENISDFDKFLQLFILFFYIITSLLAISKWEKYINLVVDFIYNDDQLNIKEDISILLLSSLLLVAIYYLLLVTASFLRNIISAIINNIHYLYMIVFKHYRESKIRKDYQYNYDIVFKFRAREYAEETGDERIKKALEEHDIWVNTLFDRKRNLMVIVILLIINFFIHPEFFHSLHRFTKLYWLIIATMTFYAALIPYDYLMFMHIRNNKIRK